MTELYSKEGFRFVKNENNNYNLSFEMENNNINLSKIIDLGLPQRFSYVHVKKTFDSNSISFELQTIKSNRPEGMPSDAELMPMKNMNCNCDIITQHKIRFTFNVLFENHMLLPPVVEKIVGLILYKIFNRVKQFIENVRI